MQVRADDQELENAVGALANLALSPRQVLGQRNVNEAAAPRPAEGEVKKKKTQAEHSQDGVIVISDDENELYVPPGGVRLHKAAHLSLLARKVPDTTDNAALSKLVLEFWQVLSSNRSRALTKEGFAFLDALYKQLTDPSVYVVPMRTSRTRGHTTENPVVLDRQAKMNELFKLRIDVGRANSNETLAKMDGRES